MKKCLATSFVVPALAGCLLFVSHALAQSKPSWTDDELRKRLDSNPVDDYDHELLGGRQATPGDKRPADEMPGEMEKRLRTELGKAAEKENDGNRRLLDVSRWMREVQTQLVKKDAGATTQKMQQRIIADLERMIDDARKQGQCQPGGKQQGSGSRTPAGTANTQPKQGGSNQNTPNPTEANITARLGKPGSVVSTAETRKTIAEFWNRLPERVRGPLIQLSDEDFLPEYQGLIEDYFRRLSEEKQPQNDRR
jgi:hypothetical protein